MDIEERLEKLKTAYEAGKVNKEIYEENLAKLEAEMKAFQKNEPSMDDLLSDILKEEIYSDKQENGDPGSDATGYEMTGTKGNDDDELLLDDLFDSLVLKEEMIECPLCGTSLPLGTETCSNCDARMSEAGELIEEISFDTLAESIEDGLAELEDMAEGFGLDDGIENELADQDDVLDGLDEELASLDDLDELENVGDELTHAPAQSVPVATHTPESAEEPVAKSITKAATGSGARQTARPVVEPDSARAAGEPDIAEVVDVIPGDITEEEVSRMSLAGMRMVDLIIIGTLAGLITVFIIFKLYYLSNFNALSLGMFSGVALSGMMASYMMFRISSSAIAEGDRLFKAGKYEDALVHYEKGIKLSSKPATAWTSRGVALKRLGDFGGALRSHNTALRLNPKNEIAWCNKGDLLFRLNKYNEALECYDNAIDLNPRYAIAWNNKGTTLARMERYAEAKECQDMATRLKPKYAAAWVNKAEILAKLGKRQEAIACYRRAQRLIAA